MSHIDSADEARAQAGALIDERRFREAVEPAGIACRVVDVIVIVAVVDHDHDHGRSPSCGELRWVGGRRLAASAGPSRAGE